MTRIIGDEEIIVRALREFASSQRGKAGPWNAGLVNHSEYLRRAKRADKLALAYERSLPGGGGATFLVVEAATPTGPRGES